MVTKDGKLRGQRRVLRAAGAHGVRGGGHVAQRHVREGVPGHVRARREPASTSRATSWRSTADGFELEPVRAGGGPRREGGLLHLVPEGRPPHLVLRRQPPHVRGQRGEGHGEREGRLPRGGAAVREGSGGAGLRATSWRRRGATRSWRAHFATLDEALLAAVVAVNRLTPTIVEVVVKAPFAAQHFEPGQFYRLQNFERQRAGGGRHAPDDGGPGPHGRVGGQGEGADGHHRAGDGLLAPGCAPR